MDNLIFFLALYLPFQIALNPTEGIDLASVRIIIPVLFILWLARGLKNKKIIVKNTIITAFLTIFLVLNLFSALISKNIDWSARKLLFLFSIFPIYFVISAVISDKNKMEKTIKFLLWGGFLAALVGIFQFLLQFITGLEKTYKFWATFFIWPFLGNSFGVAVLKNNSWLVNISGKTYLRAISTFPDPHMFSFYLGLLIPLSIGMALKHKKFIYLLFLIILIFADILTFSRGGYLGILAGVLAISFLIWNKFNAKYKTITLIVAALVLGILFFPGPVSERLASSLNLSEGSNSSRIEIWQKTVKIILDKPFLGVGIGNYPLEIKPSADWREPIYAHNTYLDIAVETGIINALIWIGLLAFSITAFLKKSKKENFFLWLAISLVIFSTHSLVETAVYSPVVLTLLLMIISFANIKIEDEKTF